MFYFSDMEQREIYMQKKQFHTTIQKTSTQIKKYTNINYFTMLAW